MSARTRSDLLRRLLAGGVVLTAILALLPMATAQASLSRRTVERTGTCRAGTANWDLKAKRLAGHRIYIEFEVDQIPRGARWQLFVSYHGRRIAAVTKTARTSKGVQVNRVRPNRAGRDRIQASAVNPTNRNTCYGSLRY